MKKIIVVLMTIMIMVTGCDYQIYDAKPLRDTIEIKKEDAPINKSVTELIFASETAVSLFAIDAYGNVHEFNKGDVRDAKIGMRAKAAMISEQNGEIIDISLNELDYLIYQPLVVKGTKDEVVLRSAKLILQSYIGRSDTSLAIKSNKLIKAEVTESFSDNKFEILMIFEVEPMPFAYRWGEVNEEGKVVELSYTYILYGINNDWMFDRNITTGEIGNMTQEFIYEPLENQVVLYESDTYSYVEQHDYISGEKIDSEGTLSDFKTPIYRIRRSSGSSTRMYSGSSDINYSYHPFYQAGDELFVSTKVWEQDSEIAVSYTGVLDVNRKYMTELINEPSSYGTIIGNKAYIFTETKIKAIDLDTKDVDLVVDLPLAIDFTYGGAEVLYTDESNIYLFISDGNVSSNYKLNIETKVLTKN